MLPATRRPPRYCPGNQLLGVAHALLTMGSAGVIATTLPTPDDETAVLMDALHRNLADGLDAGAALLAARRTLDLDSPAGTRPAPGSTSTAAELHARPSRRQPHVRRRALYRRP